MDLGDVPDNTVGIDPVSGNEIPLGSTAANVRDDIPTNLSEGEIVVPADVVNYWGVKLFEDLRAQAKMGYAQMEKDGRIGGQPMEEDTSDVGIEITLDDLDIVEEDATEDAFLGKFFAGIREANRKAREERDKQKVRDIFKNAANKDSKKNKKQKDKPRRPKLKEKPATSDNVGPSIAEQINFGGDFEDTPPSKKSGAYKASRNTPNSKTQNVRYYDKGFIERLLEGLGFDEGGLVEEETVVEQEEQPRKVYEKKGGFNMQQALRVPNVQIYTFENEEGHRIHITYIDGIPQSEIPPGYVQVGDPVNVNTTDSTEDPTDPPEDPTVEPDPTPTETGTSTGGGSSSGGGSSTPTPDPVNYKELTMEELTKMIEDQKKLGSKFIKNINPLVRVAMWNESRKLKAELERRRDDPFTSEVDKIRYDQLLELANRDEPGLISTLLGKITGNDPNAPTVRTQEQTDALYNQLDKMTKAYTPDTQTSSTYKPPNPTKTAAEKIQDEIDIKRIEDEMKSQPRPMDDDTFDAMGGYDGSNDEPYVPPTYNPNTTQDALDNQSAAEDAMGRSSSPKPTVSTPTVRGNTRLDKDAQRRRNRQEANKNIKGSTARKTGLTRSATRGLSTTEKKGGAGLDSRFGISGLEKGGLASKKKKSK